MAQPNRLKSADSEDSIVEACLRTLRTLGRSVVLEFVEQPAARGAVPPHDGLLRIRFQSGRPARFLVEVKRTHLSYTLASGIIERVKATRDDWVLFAPYVAGPVGHHLTAHEVSYVDAVGNCHVETKAGGLLAHVEGKKIARGGSESTGVRLPGYLRRGAPALAPNHWPRPRPYSMVRPHQSTKSRAAHFATRPS
jgi:hypothetical protein